MHVHISDNKRWFDKGSKTIKNDGNDCVMLFLENKYDDDDDDKS